MPIRLAYELLNTLPEIEKRRHAHTASLIAYLMTALTQKSQPTELFLLPYANPELNKPKPPIEPPAVLRDMALFLHITPRSAGELGDWSIRYGDDLDELMDILKNWKF